jgi:hypothetical protein
MRCGMAATFEDALTQSNQQQPGLLQAHINQPTKTSLSMHVCVIYPVTLSLWVKGASRFLLKKLSSCCSACAKPMAETIC